MRLIDADTLKEVLVSHLAEFMRKPGKNISQFLVSILDKVDAAPTMKFTLHPVVHAKWMIHYYNLDSYSYKDVPYDETTFDNPCGLMFCSHCDKEALLNGVEEYDPSRYCPHCGARMDGGAGMEPNAQVEEENRKQANKWAEEHKKRVNKYG